jgi:hypothetical protein
MKTKNLNKKLTLHKTTVANLGHTVMSNVKGGSGCMGSCATEGATICQETAPCPITFPSDDPCWTTGGEGGADCTVAYTCYQHGCN